MYKKQNII